MTFHRRFGKKQKLYSSTCSSNSLKKSIKTGDEGSWAKRETNWNVVCNTGMSFGALAISEDYPDLAKEIIDNAVKYIPNCLKHFQPDGVCYEGPSYWEYTTMHLAMFLKLLNDNFKTDYGLGELPGISKTARYYVNTVSPSEPSFQFCRIRLKTTQSTNHLFFLL